MKRTREVLGDVLIVLLGMVTIVPLMALFFLLMEAMGRWLLP